uniref:Transposase n=1 Tax=Romanomermis culicivorax TaxID=13658 RepID=A0A915KAM0_ROMCU
MQQVYAPCTKNLENLSYPGFSKATAPLSWAFFLCKAFSINEGIFSGRLEKYTNERAAETINNNSRMIKNITPPLGHLNTQL